MGEAKKLVLIDGHAMLYRAWFAFPQSLTMRDGKLINAVYGFTRILLNVIEEMHPEYLAVSFDVGKTFRHEMYPEYKAHREKMPEELKEQEPMVDRVLNALNVPVVAKDGFEADDVIGTLAKQASGQDLRFKIQDSRKYRTTTPSNSPLSSGGVDTVIVTGDKDILQLVVDPSASSGQVRVYMPGRGMKGPVTYNEKTVEEDLGVRPEQIPDLKGLMGDTSDNIPGIRGVGPKSAVSLLSLFGSIEKLYSEIESGLKRQDFRFKNKANNILKPGLLQKLKEGKERAFESKKLATIVRDVPIQLNLPACEVRQFDKGQAIQLFEELEFTSLINKLPRDAFEESVQEALF